MIFVNDLWSLEGVPKWLEHSAAKDDAMGLSDVVFPAFLFIVGLSIPFAISNRRKHGDGNLAILGHILLRSFALLLMGIYIVNLENAVDSGMMISKYVWEILMVIAFLLIWNVYPDKLSTQTNSLKAAGWILLVFLGIMYKGGDPANPSGMETHWYGILGLIGWSYLLCALAYLWVGDNMIGIVLAWLFFVAFNLAEFAGILDFLDPVHKYVWIVGSGSMPAFTMAGVTLSVIYRKKMSDWTPNILLAVLVGLGVICLAYGFATRPFWGISKIRATPAWIGICSGISFISFAVFYYIVDFQGKKDWAKLIKPAGTATLTCYLVPYIWYAVNALFGLALPMFLRTGMIGLLKSLIFSLAVIVLTGFLNKRGIRLKI